MSNTRYKVGETTYDIPENKVDSFLQAKPNAVLVNEGKQNAPQTPDATVEQNTTASNSENTSLATEPTEVKTVVELPEVAPVFYKDLEITTDEVRQKVKWGFHELGVIGNLNSKYEALLDGEETIVDSNGKEVRNPEYLEFTRSDLDFGGGKSIYIRSNQLTYLQKENLGDMFGLAFKEESGLVKIKLPKANASQEEWNKTTAAINEVIKTHYEGIKSSSVVETNQEKVDRVSTISSTLKYETENIKLREQIEYAVGEEKKRLEEALRFNEENKDELVDYYKNYDEASETYKYNKAKVKDNLSEIERIRKEADRRYDDMVGTEYQQGGGYYKYQESQREQYVDSFVENYKSNLSPNQVDKINKTSTYEKAIEELITETDIYGPTFGMEYEASGEKIDVSFLNDEQKIKLLRGLNGREIAQLAEGDFSVAMKEQQINTSLWSLLNESREQMYEEFEDASSQAKELTQSKKDIDLESQDIQRLSNEINLEFETLNSQVEEVQSILEGDTDKLAQLNSTIEQMKSNPSGYTDAQKQNAINEFNTTLTRINETQGELNTLSDQYKDIEDRNSNLQSRSDALNAKIGQFNSEQENYFKELEKLNKRESSLASTYGFTISGEVIGNRFEITDKYQEWKNKNVSGTNSDGTPFNSGFFGSVRDLGNRIGQGLAIEVIDLYVGTGVWATNLLGSFMKGATGIGSYSDSDQVYDRYDQLNAMYKNYISDASFVAVADNLEGSAFSSYKHSMQTIGNMLPFTLALIGSMRKGNFSNTQAMYKQLSKKGFSKRKLEVLKTTEIGFRLTAIDQYQEAKDLGLNDDQALGYSTFTGLAIGLSNSVFSGEFGFGKQQAVREIFKVFSGNLKKAATKKAINKTINEATVNLFQEFGEEEVELMLSDIAKHSFGLSHAAEFTNFETHQQIVEGTILLSGTLKGVGGGSIQDFKRFKGEIYDGFRQRSGEVIEDINSQIAAIDAKIEQQKNPQYIGPKSADLLEQMKNELIQARDYGMLIQNAINLSPENVTNEQLDLIIQKNELLATKKDTDPAFHAMFDEEINKLNEQIQNSDVTSVARQNFERTVSNTEKIINAINPSLGNRKIQFKSFDGENSTQDMYDFLVGETDLDLETAEETIGSHGGAFVANGVEYIIINKPVSLSSTGANVAAHELLHKMMFMSMAERDGKGNLITDKNNQPVINKETSMALAKGLGSYIMGIDATKVENSIFSSRLRAYQEAPASVQAQEVLTLFSDALATGDIKFEEGRFEKIGKFLEKAYQAIGLPISTGDSKNLGVKLKTGKDIFNFLKGFNESIKKGSLTADQKAMFLEGATIEGELADLKVDEDIVEASTAEREEEGSVIMSSKETPLEAINKILPEDIKTKEQYDNFISDPRESRKLFNSIIEPGGVINNYIRSRQLTKEEGDKIIERVTDRVLGFNPEETRADGSVVGREGFGERVFADTRFSKLDAKKALAIEAERTKQQTSLDDELAKEAVAEETTGRQPERKTKLKVLADQLNVSKQVDGAVANADVDVTSIFSFKSVPNAVAGTVGELMGISPAKIKSKANLTKSELASAQRFIKKNVGVLIGMMPEGFDSSGKATGVPKTMLDAFYTKRESRAKTKAGLQTQVKRVNIKDSEFLEVFNIFEGVPDRSDRNTSARVIALANLIGKVMTNQSIRKQNPGILSIADGMSKIMFSKDINSKSKESEDVNLNKFEGKQKQKDWLINFGFATLPKSFWINNGQLVGSGAKYTNITVDGKKTKKYELNNGERVAARKMLFANVDQLNDFINEYEQNGGTFAPESVNIEASVKRTTVYGKKTDKQVRDQINKNQDLYNKSDKGFIDTWLAIQQDIKDNPNNKKHWAALLEVTSTSQANWMRVASRLIGSNTLGLKNVEEHMSPATDFAQYLFEMAKIGKLTPSVMKKAMKSFTQISLPEIYDNLLKGEGFDYTKNLPLEYKFEILSGIMPSWVRYINPQVNAQVHTINGVEYKGMNPNVLILADGKNLAQTYGLGVDSSLEMNQDVISVQQELLFKVFMNNITKAEAVSQLNDYVSNMIPAASSILMFSKDIDANKANINPKGITILDFDDTLATTKSGVRYTMPNPSGKPQPKRKAILIAGNAGAGKTTVINQLGLRKQGFKYVNQDIALDWLTKNNGLPKDMNEFTRKQAEKWRELGGQAAVAAKNKASKLRGQGDGVVIDGTGAVGVQFQDMARKFKDAGYDVQIIFVESSLETALERNANRSERRLTDATVRNAYEATQKNKKAFKEMVTFFPYSAKGFIEINTDNLKQGGALPSNLVETMDNFTKGYIKGRLNAEEFALQGQTLLGEGAEFDFSEFNKVVEGKTAPLFNKAMKLQGKFGPENMFVLTARPAEAQGPIFDFLKANGLNIPLKNITGLGNSTAEAKAMWVAGKFSEGYNDFYFADDAIQNVKAVDNILEQFDVKRKVQQAKINFSKDLDPKFNQMLERSAGVGAFKIFSKVEAAKRGKNKGRFTFFVPPSAEDFTGLLRYFAGTGKQGDADIQFFNEALVKPFARADRAMSQMKQTIRDDYNALRKKFPKVKKKLGKLIEGTTFTNDMAIRVYLFEKAGYETPGLSKQGKAKLLLTVKTDPEMRAFADALGIISKQKDGYLKPSEYWNTENIALDLQNATNKVGRKQFLQEWVQNKEIIFSPANMNKIEAVYGTQFRQALEDVLYRMENGTNRSRGKNYGQGWTNWVNNSVGAIMFFNGRSAVLQTLSTVNFINFEDNNIFAAGKAFANQKQYWSDFSFLFNSDFLRNRRAGLATNVNEAELASAVAGATNKAKAALGYLLKIGFTPTQIADSFAIASGGATYYRNRINTYLKSGMSQDQAEARAMLDFQEIAEETQQSARPDRISQQQASNLGRIILAFANTPMQYNRLIKKAAGDLVNRRGDWRANVSRILYYGAIQNFIFASLQNALFALAFDEDDEELTESQQAARDRKEDTKNSRILNSMFDSLARGSGVYGAALATIKNAILEFYEQEEKGFRADYNQVAIELLNVSPPLGSKVRKLASAGYTRKVQKDVMQEMSMLDYDNPAWQSIGNVVEATTNIPMARVIRKADNLREAFNQENSAMQRVFLALGWSAWDLDVGTEVVKNEGKKNEYVVTLDTKRMKQYEVEKKIDERKTEERREEAKKNKIKKKEEEAKKNEQEVKKNIEKQKEEGDDATCAAISSKGNRCKRKVVDGKSFCTVHEKVEKSESGEMKQCKKIKSDGNRCGVKTNSKSGLCYYHD